MSFGIGRDLRNFSFSLDEEQSQLFSILSGQKNFRQDVSRLLREIGEDTKTTLRPDWRHLGFTVRRDKGKAKPLNFNGLNPASLRWSARNLEAGELAPLILLACSLTSLIQLDGTGKKTYNPLLIPGSAHHIVWVPDGDDLERLHRLQSELKQDEEFKSKFERQLVALLEPLEEGYQFDPFKLTLSKESAARLDIVSFRNGRWEQVGLQRKEASAALVCICFTLNYGTE